MRLLVTSKIFGLHWSLVIQGLNKVFFQMFGSHCSLVIQVLQIIQNLMFPEKIFYNHDKLAFLVRLYETLSSALNKSNDDGHLGLFQKKKSLQTKSLD